MLANAVEKLTAEEVAYILNETVKWLAKRGVFKQSRGHFALDSSDLETTPRYQGAGKKKVTVRKKSRAGQYVEHVEYVYGFKVVVIYEVRLRLIVAAQVAPINRHESNFTSIFNGMNRQFVDPGFRNSYRQLSSRSSTKL